MSFFSFQERFRKNLNQENIPGPGNYEINKNLIKKSFQKKPFVHSKQRLITNNVINNNKIKRFEIDLQDSKKIVLKQQIFIKKRNVPFLTNLTKKLNLIEKNNFPGPAEYFNSFNNKKKRSFKGKICLQNENDSHIVKTDENKNNNLENIFRDLPSYCDIIPKSVKNHTVPFLSSTKRFSLKHKKSLPKKIDQLNSLVSAGITMQTRAEFKKLI